jgi:hypothetical protein
MSARRGVSVVLDSPNADYGTSSQGLLLQRFTRLRVDKEIEIEGLDVNLDGETVQ